MSISNHASPAFQEYLHELRNVCGNGEVLPKSYTLSSSPLTIGLPSISGSAHEGTFNGMKVRIQRVIMYPNGDPQTFKMVRFGGTFLHAWTLKKSPGLPPNGRRVEKLVAPEPCLSPGCHHRSHPTRFELDAGYRPNGIHHEPSRHGQIESRRCPLYHAVRPAYPFPSHLISPKACITSTSATLFMEISEGYAIVLDRFTTGILTPNQPTVLVDTTGRARITDCGLAMVTRNLDSVRSAPDEHGDNTRWAAPEILANRGTFSKEADVFSFAMVLIEVRYRFRIDI